MSTASASVFPVFPDVILSLMPKGVEHYKNENGQIYKQDVILSLMPKGVEHTNKERESLDLANGDSFVDAERR